MASASSETASSTSAAPMSRAWRSWRLERHLLALGDVLGEVEHPRGLLALGDEVVVEVVPPVDLDDVDRHELGLVRPRELAAEVDDARVHRSAVEAEDSALDRLAGGSRGHDGKPTIGSGSGGRRRGGSPGRSALAPSNRAGDLALGSVGDRRDDRVVATHRARSPSARPSGCGGSGPTSGAARTRAGRRW